MKLLFSLVLSICVIGLAHSGQAEQYTSDKQSIAVPKRLDPSSVRLGAAIQSLAFSGPVSTDGELSFTSRPGRDAWQCTGTSSNIQTACFLACRIAQDWQGCACSSIDDGCECDCD